MLQRKRSGGVWSTVASATTGGRGNVSYRVHPRRPARYRLEVLGSGGRVEAKSPAVNVRVT